MSAPADRVDPAERAATDARLDRAMQRASRALAVLALLMMAVGFVLTLGQLPELSAAVVLGTSGASMPRAHDVLFAGVLTLALLPAVRVFLAALFYLRARRRFDVLVAVVVLVELLIGMLARS